MSNTINVNYMTRAYNQYQQKNAAKDQEKEDTRDVYKRQDYVLTAYDAMTAHTAVVFTRYMMLSLESRESNDNRSLSEIFLYFSDEMSDITWIQAFQMLLQMFRTMLTENTELSDEKISELVDAFMNTLPMILKTQMQAA